MPKASTKRRRNCHCGGYGYLVEYDEDIRTFDEDNRTNSKCLDCRGVGFSGRKRHEGGLGAVSEQRRPLYDLRCRALRRRVAWMHRRLNVIQRLRWRSGHTDGPAGVEAHRLQAGLRYGRTPHQVRAAARKARLK